MAAENTAVLPILDKAASATSSFADKLTSTAKPLTNNVASVTSSYPWLKYLLIFLLISFLLFILALYVVKRYFNIDFSTVLGVIAAVPKAKAGDEVKANDAKPAGKKNGVPQNKSAVNVLGEKMDKDKKESGSVASARGSTTMDTEPQPDEAGSVTQASKGKSKSGYCYIGEDRGFRSCIKVGEGDKCMSGDIFPSQDICINPTLRE